VLKGELKARSGLEKLSAVESALGGAVSASVAQAIATPLDVARVRIITADRSAGKSPPLEYFWPYPIFEAVRYDEMQRDIADTAGYS